MMMFDGPEFPKSLDLDVFNEWLENGRQNVISYSYLLIIWDEFENDYRPIYEESRDHIEKYERYQEATSRESLVAAYDLFSEARLV